MRELLFLYCIVFFPVLGRIYRPAFHRNNEIAHARPEREDDGQKCDEDQMMNFLADIQVLNPESIMKIATFNEIAPSCFKVQENLEKVHDYLKGCKPANQPDLYMQLIKGVETLHHKLCHESPFRKKFDEIHTCLHELRHDLEECDGPADWNENSDEEDLCTAYKNIIDCYYIKTAKVCGTSAAKITKELLQCIIDSILTVSCGSKLGGNPSVDDPMPEAYIQQSNKQKSKENNAGDKSKNSVFMATIVMIVSVLLLQ